MPRRGRIEEHGRQNGEERRMDKRTYAGSQGRWGECREGMAENGLMGTKFAGNGAK